MVHIAGRIGKLGVLTKLGGKWVWPMGIGDRSVSPNLSLSVIESVCDRHQPLYTTFDVHTHGSF